LLNITFKRKAEMKRDSGLELLRIVCLLFIIIGHFFVHGGYEAYLNSSNLCSRIKILQCLSMFSRAACNVFVLISGYFYSKETGFGKFLKKILSLEIQMATYSWIILAVFCLIGIPLSRTYIIHAIFPVLYGNWYVVDWCFFMLFCPLINSIVKLLDIKGGGILLILYLMIWSIIPTFTKAWSVGVFGMFFVMYYFGAYMRLCEEKNYVIESKKFSILAYTGLFLSVFMMCASVLILDKLGISLQEDKLIIKATYFREYNTPLSVLFAISIFCIFKKLHFYNKWINKIALSVCGIYLLHDNEILRGWIWTEIVPNINYLHSKYFSIHLLGKCSLIILIGCIIEHIRVIILQKKVDKQIAKWRGKG